MDARGEWRFKYNVSIQPDDDTRSLPIRWSMSKAGRMMNLFSAARLGIAIERYRRTKDATYPAILASWCRTTSSLCRTTFLPASRWSGNINDSPRYKIAVRRHLILQSWTYDAVLAAIQAGDLGSTQGVTPKAAGRSPNPRKARVTADGKRSQHGWVDALPA